MLTRNSADRIDIPLPLIAGWYATTCNREVGPWAMPALGWASSGPAALVHMLVVAGGLAAFFRKRGWI